jgi:RNA polymerase-binding transcription factor DksA
MAQPAYLTVSVERPQVNLFVAIRAAITGAERFVESLNGWYVAHRRSYRYGYNLRSSSESSRITPVTITAADRDRLWTAIEIERERIVDQIANLRTSFTGIVDAAELTSTDDEHDPEGTTIAYERAQVSALLHQAEEDLLALDTNLALLENSTIETCESCGGEIALERLLALPGTRTCITCAS